MSLPVSQIEMQLVSQYVAEVSGIVIDVEKAYFVQSRLEPLLQQERAVGYADVVRRARQDPTGELRMRIIDAVTTKETSFFRDRRPFDLLIHKLVPDLFSGQPGSGAGGRKHLSIWSAACATGQEVYSIAISLKELLFDLSRYWIKILGTDISEAALESASKGEYSAHQVSRGLEEKHLKRYFVPRGDGYRINDELRATASFQRLNLLKPFRHVGTYDIIFCRNVAIYFDAEVRRGLFQRMAEQLRPGGVLVVGSTESLLGISHRFEHETFHGATYYRRVM